MTIYAYTSCTFSYLNRAKVLSSSLRRQHPDWKIWLVLTDKVPTGYEFDLDASGYNVCITADELFGETTDMWLFGHDIVEACTAVKGRALTHLLALPDCEKVFYFDPDIAVFNSMSDVERILDSDSIVVTPHQTEPDLKSNAVAIRDNEITSLDYGIFNLGFIAVRNDAEGNRFAQWWEDRLADWCHDNLEIGLFVDQKWCNLIPCFFDNVKVLRDPGYNVASWNLSQRVMTYDDEGTALINGRPLRFFHFTKLGLVGDTMTQRYAKENVEVYELWWWYRHAVAAVSSVSIPKGWWFYGCFENGDAVPKNVRELYRSRPDLRAAFPQPFECGTGSFHEWLHAHTKLLGEEAAYHGFVAV